MTRKTLETSLGGITFTVLAFAAAALMEVGRINPMRDKQYVWVQFDDANFLSRGNNVRVAGMTVGLVEDLELNEKGVLVRLVVEPEVVIRDGYVITVRSLTALGGRYVEIDGGDPSRARVRSAERRAFHGTAEPELFKTISSTFAEAEPHLVSAVANVGEVMDKISTAQGTLGKLLSEDGFQQDYRRVSERFEATTRQIRGMIAKVDEASGTLGKLLYDPRFQNVAEGLRERVSSIGGKVGAGTGAIGALVVDEDLGRSIEAARAHLAAVLDELTAEDGVIAAGGRAEEIRANLGRTMDNLAKIRESLSEGGGPLIALTQDPAVVRDLELTREHLAVFANRPPSSSLPRFTSEPGLAAGTTRAFQNFGGTLEATDIPPVSWSVMGQIRGYMSPPPRRRTLSVSGGGN